MSQPDPPPSLPSLPGLPQGKQTEPGKPPAKEKFTPIPVNLPPWHGPPTCPDCREPLPYCHCPEAPTHILRYLRSPAGRALPPAAYNALVARGADMAERRINELERLAFRRFPGIEDQLSKKKKPFAAILGLRSRRTAK